MPSSEQGSPTAHVAGDNTPESIHDLGFDLPPPARVSKTRIVGFVALMIAILGAAFAASYLPRLRARAALMDSAKARETQVPKVDVVSPKAISSDKPVVLPATIQPLEETVVYPRASGYVRNWLVDIGDKVEKDQVVAEIDTPDLDQQIDQARAQIAQADAAVVQAKASADLAKVTSDRTEKLALGGINSQQDVDQTRGALRVALANVNAAEANEAAARANVARLDDLKAFAHVTTPFAGTVTARTVERGALVTEGQSTPLFKVAVLNPMRVIVAVPQDVAPGVRNNAEADVIIREFGNEKMKGTIARSSRELDAATRTMATEIRVPNPDGKLIAGMFAEVALTLGVPHRVLEIPATALYTDANGQRVAVVDKDNRVRFLPVTVERDTGSTIYISGGLSGDERIVKLADVQLAEDEAVEASP